jgi:phosphatidylserine/phosphatidylglycerophosphate/cardiolipin synthase-like enzyme
MKYSIFLFLTLFTLSGCFHEYFEHWENTHTQPKLSEVQSPPLQGNLSTLPDKAVLEKLIALLDAATERIWVETYTWTEKETQEAIIRAKNR